MSKNIVLKANVIAFASSLSLCAHAVADTARNWNVPAGNLVAALKAFATQSDVQLMYQPEQLRDLQTDGVKGSYEPRDAVVILLKGTQLQVHTDASSGAMVIAPAPQQSVPVSQSAEPMIEEVIVSAQKRGDERLQDVPISVSVTSPEDLSGSRKVLLRDYYMEIPGLSAGPRIGGGQGVAIRGITTGGLGIPTVGFLIDAMPFGTSGSYGGGLVPDIEPSDLERLEVLRGPQGVLYGSSAMGGLINYVTKAADPSGFAGHVEAGTSTIDDGSTGYSVSGALNIPLGDRFAIRASAFTRLDPGYIDNPRTGENDLNDADASGFRATASWQPNEYLSVRVNALRQKTSTNGSSDVVIDPGLRDLEQNLVADSGITEREVEAYSAHVRLDLAAFDVTYDGSFSSFVYDSRWDASANAVFGAAAAQAFGDRSALYNLRFPFDIDSHELRLSMSASESFDIFVGGFYSKEDADQTRVLYASEPTSGVMRGVLGTTDGPHSGFEEYAAFTNMTYRFNERFDVQAGVRQSWLRRFNVQSTGTGTLSGVINPDAEISDEVTTYLFTPSFRWSPQTMVYARFATGYRAGAINNAFAVADGAPDATEPDETFNYELGLKTGSADGRWNLAASAYYIDWSDVQISLITERTRFAYGTNGGAAKSQGIELSLTTQPLDGLKIAGWVVFNDAELSEDLPALSTVRGLKGERLPDSSQWSGSLSVDQAFRISPNAELSIGGTVGIVDDRLDVFTGSGVRKKLPGYEKIDLRASLDIKNVLVSAFVTNVTDERGVIGFGEVSYLGNVETYIQPRTYGVRVRTSF